MDKTGMNGQTPPDSIAHEGPPYVEVRTRLATLLSGDLLNKEEKEALARLILQAFCDEHGGV